MVTPAGLPAWTRTADPDTYGGIATKRDLGGIGAVNAKTDVTAAEYIRLAVDVAGAVHGASLFWMRILVDYAGGSAVATVEQCCTQWSGPSGWYAGVTPPSGNWPTVATYSLDHDQLEVTFPGLVSGTSLVVADAYGVDGSFNLSSVRAGSHAITFDTNMTSFAIGACTTDGEVLHLVVC
jgi:hypothetical protein